MEVHAHTHTPRKKWTHYFWEFLMLFLAVFCGFFAENQREHMIEHQREKKYIRSFIEDLKSDIYQSEIRLKEYSLLVLKQDSLMNELISDKILTDSRRAFLLWRTNYGFNDFTYNDRTIQQFKNSGALRLIRNKAVSDSIMKYDQLVRNVLSQQSIMNNFLSTGQLVYQKLFDFIAIKNNKEPGNPIPLSQEGRKMLNEAYANREFWSDALKFLIRQVRIMNETGKQIIIFIKKEYHFE